MDIRQIYEREIRKLTPQQRLELARHILADLKISSSQVVDPTLQEAEPELTLLDMRGLGKEIWEGVDTSRYIDSLREEWDHRQ